jgi:hypothetical protein
MKRGKGCVRGPQGPFQMEKRQAPSKDAFKQIQGWLEFYGLRMRPFENPLPGSIRFDIEVRSGRIAPLTPADHCYDFRLWTYHHFSDGRFNFGFEVEPEVEDPEAVKALIQQVVDEVLSPESISISKSTQRGSASRSVPSVREVPESESDSGSDTEDTIPYSDGEEEMEPAGPPVGLVFPGSPVGKLERAQPHDRTNAIKTPLPFEELDLADELSLGPFSQDLSLPHPDSLQDVDFSTYHLFDLGELLKA